MKMRTIINFIVAAIFFGVSLVEMSDSADYTAGFAMGVVTFILVWKWLQEL